MERWPKIFTWNVNPAYLLSLAKASLEIYIPLDRGTHSNADRVSMGSNVHEVSPEEVRSLSFDCIIFQSPRNYLIDQHILFSPDQHTRPKIYLEHEPPNSSPADSFHIVDDPDITLVHTSYFNKLMWDNNHTPVHVIEHGIADPGITYTGELEKGIVCIDNFITKGRNAGLDILFEVRKKIPLDVIGSGSKAINGLGEVPWNEIAEYIAPYRFYFNPARYLSKSAVMCEAMMIGVPVVALPTTDSSSIICNGVSGFLSLDSDELISSMRLLLDDPAKAITIGQEGRLIASQRFNLSRFTGQWEKLVMKTIHRRYQSPPLKARS